MFKMGPYRSKWADNGCLKTWGSRITIKVEINLSIYLCENPIAGIRFLVLVELKEELMKMESGNKNERVGG